MSINDLQRGGFSSFNLPDKGKRHRIWTTRCLPGEGNVDLAECQLRERQVLEEHARHAGCKLIVNPNLYEELEPAARIARLQTLSRFLESMPDRKAQVAFDYGMTEYESLTILGDWFSAECIPSPIGKRYRFTIFTRHAPFIWDKIRFFDEEFQDKLQERGWTPESSRRKAIEAIRNKLSRLKP